MEPPEVIKVQPVTLQGNGILLEPLTMDHADGIAKAAQDGELWHLFFTFVPHPDDVAEYIQSAISGPRRQSNPWGRKRTACFVSIRSAKTDRSGMTSSTRSCGPNGQMSGSTCKTGYGTIKSEQVRPSDNHKN